MFRVENPKLTGELFGVKLYNGILIRVRGRYYVPYFMVTGKLIDSIHNMFLPEPDFTAEFYDKLRHKLVDGVSSVLYKRLVSGFTRYWHLFECGSKCEYVQDNILELLMANCLS